MRAPAAATCKLARARARFRVCPPYLHSADALRDSAALLCSCQADIARAALAFAGFKTFRVPQQVDPATKVYQTVIPAALQYTDAQWNNNHYEARPARRVQGSKCAQAPASPRQLQHQLCVHPARLVLLAAELPKQRPQNAAASARRRPQARTH